MVFGGEVESAVDLVGRTPLGKVGSWTGWTGDRLPKTRELGLSSRPKSAARETQPRPDSPNTLGIAVCHTRLPADGN